MLSTSLAGVRTEHTPPMDTATAWERGEDTDTPATDGGDPTR